MPHHQLMIIYIPNGKGLIFPNFAAWFFLAKKFSRSRFFLQPLHVFKTYLYNNLLLFIYKA